MNKMEKNNSNLTNRKFYIHTFGCQMNENDSEHIAGILASAGAELSYSAEESDIIIINTCAVREKSVEKFYSLLGRLACFKKKKNIIIGVIGCVSQLYRSKILDKNPHVDFIIGPDNYWKMPQIFSRLSSEKVISTQWNHKWHEIPCTQSLRKSHYSAYVTIMEGCNNFCTYCVVPFTRGREKCRPIQNILREMRYLSEKGYKEIYLLGQDVNSYVAPDSGETFCDLLKKADKIEEIGWIRFISSHPKYFTPEIAIVISEGNNICHQIHLPVQSGSSSILRKMNRGYTRDEYLEKIDVIHKLIPDVALSTDIIVGFPEETEEDFNETLSLLKTVRYTNIFSFRYSPRPLTAASKIRDSVPLREKRGRLVELQTFQRNLQLEINKSFIGKSMKVLCLGKSKKDPNIYSGRNEGNQVVNFKSKKDVRGKFIDVSITGYGPYSLQGKLNDIT